MAQGTSRQDVLAWSWALLGLGSGEDGSCDGGPAVWVHLRCPHGLTRGCASARSWSSGHKAQHGPAIRDTDSSPDWRDGQALCCTVTLCPSATLQQSVASWWLSECVTTAMFTRPHLHCSSAGRAAAYSPQPHAPGCSWAHCCVWSHAAALLLASFPCGNPPLTVQRPAPHCHVLTCLSPRHPDSWSLIGHPCQK